MLLTIKPVNVCGVMYLSMSWIDLLYEGHNLFLRADHSSDCHILIELQLGNALKALLEVGLDTQRVFRLRQDLQQLVVGQEEKPRD